MAAWPSIIPRGGMSRRLIENGEASKGKHAAFVLLMQLVEGNDCNVWAPTLQRPGNISGSIVIGGTFTPDSACVNAERREPKRAN